MDHPDAVTALAAASNWHKSSYSPPEDQNGCVEVGTVPGLVGVRDTTLAPTSPTLAFSEPAWSAFLTLLRR